MGQSYSFYSALTILQIGCLKFIFCENCKSNKELKVYQIEFKKKLKCFSFKDILASSFILKHLYTNYHSCKLSCHSMKLNVDRMSCNLLFLLLCIEKKKFFIIKYNIIYRVNFLNIACYYIRLGIEKFNTKIF